MRGSDLGFTFQHPCLSLSPFSLLGPGVKANLVVAPMSSSMALRLRPKYITTTNTSFIHCFSSSSTSDPNDTNPKDATPTSSDSSPKSQSSFASYFSDVKSSLKQQKQPHSQTQPRKSSFNTSTIRTPSTAASLGEIRKNLSEFRLRPAVPPPNETKDTTSPPSEQISFQELYKRNVAAKSSESPPEPGKDGRASFSLDAIRESLKQLKSSTPAAPNTDRRGSDAMSLSKYKESFKIRPQSGNVIGGGFETLPTSVFGKEMKEKNEGKSSTSASDMKTDFMKTYSFGELGEKMRMLRPEKEVDFSLDELNARLMKLREIEAKETESRKVGGVTFKDLRESLVKLKLSSEEKEKQTQIQKLGYLGQLGGTPNFMLAPPKEQLVEKYFHPDNLSSAEKLKIELQKVRDEFKMSESDCGSARVQVAQLTTKIKHLASVLHKKDKHSRKGLQEMVQRRKKLLKYIRRTDWDSYCLVLSKLGLRDNPDYKH